MPKSENVMTSAVAVPALAVDETGSDGAARFPMASDLAFQGCFGHIDRFAHANRLSGVSEPHSHKGHKSLTKSVISDLAISSFASCLACSIRIMTKLMSK